MKITALPELQDPDGAETVVVVKDRQNMQARFDRLASAAVEPMVARAETAAEQAEDAASRLGATPAPAAALLARGDDNRQVPILDRLGMIDAQRLAPTHVDPFLADLLDCPKIRWAGDYAAERGYAPGDLLRWKRDFYLTHDAASGLTGRTPDEAREHFEPVPLIEAEGLSFRETMRPSGQMFMRATSFGPTYGINGSGYLDAVVTDADYFTSAGNTYFMLNGLAPGMTEVGCRMIVPGAGTTHVTICLSPNDFAGFSTPATTMYHVNCELGTFGNVLVWDGPALASAPIRHRFAWQGTGWLGKGVAHDFVLRMRGNIMVSRVNGRLGSVHINDWIGTHASAATAAFVQNYEGEALGARRYLDFYTKAKEASV